MNARDVHPLTHLWPRQVLRERPTFAQLTEPEQRGAVAGMGRVLRNKRKAWRQKRRGRK